MDGWIPILAEAQVETLGIAVGLLGGLSIFLFGMGQMTSGLKAVAGAKLARVLRRFTKNRFIGAITGAVVTALVQSSSVTTVLLVGFVTAGLMTLQQTVSVIIGANVGSTVTAQLIAFNITAFAPVLITIGFAGIFFGKRENIRMVGNMVMGLGMIFLGMGMMAEATDPLRSYQPFIDLMADMKNPLLAILVSAAFTALIQSSAATTGIVIVLASQGFVSLEAGIALALGSNIGTCATAVLAALGKPVAAARVAAVHVLFNVIGVLIWLPFLGNLAEIVQAISPTHPELEGAARLGAETPRQIANAHTVFNIANAVLFLPFTGLLARLVEKLLPEKPVAVPERARPQFLDDVYLDTPALALERVRLEIGHLGEVVLDALDGVSPGGKLDKEAVTSAATDVNTLYKSILEYGARVSTRTVSTAEGAEAEQLLAAANSLQAISEVLALNVSDLLAEWERKDLRASEETERRFTQIQKLIRGAIQDAVTAVRDDDQALARRVIDAKETINAESEALLQRLGARLSEVGPTHLATYRLQARAVELQKRLYYFAKRIAKAVAHREDDLEVDSESESLQAVS